MRSRVRAYAYIRMRPCSWLNVDEDTLHSEYMTPHSKFVKMFSAFGRIVDATLQVRAHGDLHSPVDAPCDLCISGCCRRCGGGAGSRSSPASEGVRACR